jgi:hypothetical protein
MVESSSVMRDRWERTQCRESPIAYLRRCISKSRGTRATCDVAASAIAVLIRCSASSLRLSNSARAAEPGVHHPGAAPLADSPCSLSSLVLSSRDVAAPRILGGLYHSWPRSSALTIRCNLSSIYSTQPSRANARSNPDATAAALLERLRRELNPPQCAHTQADRSAARRAGTFRRLNGRVSSATVI